MPLSYGVCNQEQARTIDPYRALQSIRDTIGIAHLLGLEHITGCLAITAEAVAGGESGVHICVLCTAATIQERVKVAAV